MTITAGTRLGRYEIRSKLGAGGMGEVYMADQQLRRRVAIKLLSGELVADEQANKRLLKEARAAATLDHPNICSIYEVGQADEIPYLAMEFLQGQTLENKTQQRVERIARDRCTDRRRSKKLIRRALSIATLNPPTS
jgi:serine/threonine protein kinase